ncbi:hypothetical protein QQF64_020499 [Cirrhinus molitorella]|uniref:Gypsy retrotransposon integrase-like protein 1 n=1 Tax=Cirrhinus molitorella TaxID=172907 RepID=A0ABR3LCR6_9TELE
MPFGLANSPLCFQAFINEHVRVVLQRLIDHQLYAKCEKCEFHLSKISFLGYIISLEGVAMDDKKVNVVLKWPQPTTLKELQRFLGFANFYRRFIHHFSTVAAPLTAMAVLSQRQGNPPKMFPCAFYLHKLSPAERNYDVGNRELLAIKAALEEWRHWLEGAKHPFTVLTDHRNLEYLQTAKRLNHRQARWALFFTRFNFRVTYRPATQNTKAEALSRINEAQSDPGTPENILPPSLIVAPVVWDLMTEISEAQLQDPPPVTCPPDLTYVPLPLREQVLTKVHCSPSSGHPGITATLELLSNRFWWPSASSNNAPLATCPKSRATYQLAFCNRFPSRNAPGLISP